LLGATCIASGCESSDSSSGGNFDVPEGGFGVDGATFDSSSPGADGGMTADADAAANPDAGDSPLTTTLVNVPVGDKVYGAASADGSAMIVVVTANKVSTFSHYEPATGWTAGVALPGATVGQNFTLVLDGKGNAFLGWATTATLTQVDVVRYDHATAAWGAVQVPDPYAMQQDPGFGLAANASGEALLVTHHLGSGPYDIVAQHYSGGTWTQEAITTPATTMTIGAQLPVSLTDNGKAVVVWSEGGSLAFQIATRAAAGTWTLQPPTPGGVTGPASAAINEEGDVLVGYETTSEVPGAVYYDAATATWVSPAVSAVMDTATEGLCHPAVGLTQAGDGSMVRCFLAGTLAQIEGYTFSKGTATWGTKAPLASTTTGVIRGARFTPDSSGNMLVTYQAEPDGNTLTPAPQLTSVYTPATGWGPTSTALSTTSSLERDVVFTSPNGRGFVAWVEGTSLLVKKVR
jgi:hypothetical protein